MSDLRTTLLFTVKMKAAPPQMLGTTPLGERRIVAVTGGSFEGPRLRGTIVEQGGSDWILARPDGSVQLNVRVTLKTEDGALIGMRYEGYRHGPAAVIERLNRGEAVDPGEYYFRTIIMFETAAPKYAWLNNALAVGVGRRPPEGPVYDIYEIL